MLNPHYPFPNDSQHAANEYCPTCHGTQNMYGNQQNVASCSQSQKQYIDSLNTGWKAAPKEKYPKVEYYCEETIYEFSKYFSEIHTGDGMQYINDPAFFVRLWFDTNKVGLHTQHAVEAEALEVLRYLRNDKKMVVTQSLYAQTLANAFKPHGLNALSVKVEGQPADMIYTTPFQEGESSHG
jgi:hypothetical protein